MSARELHDTISRCHLHSMALSDEMEMVILSALSLAAAVEESGEEVVRELRELQEVYDCDPTGPNATAAVLGRSAALLVARSAEIERLKAEQERSARVVAEAVAEWAKEKIALKAENEALRAVSIAAQSLDNAFTSECRFRDNERHPLVANGLVVLRTALAAYRAAKGSK